MGEEREKPKFSLTQNQPYNQDHTSVSNYPKYTLEKFEPEAPPFDMTKQLFALEFER